MKNRREKIMSAERTTLPNFMLLFSLNLVFIFFHLLIEIFFQRFQTQPFRLRKEHEPVSGDEALRVQPEDFPGRSRRQDRLENLTGSSHATS